MENMNLKNKLQFLRDHKIWKCMNKTEVLEEHSSSWMRNGLSSLDYKGASIYLDNSLDSCFVHSMRYHM